MISEAPVYQRLWGYTATKNKNAATDLAAE
jgi:hypothetical protein